MPAHIDIAGRKFGKLFVLSSAGKNSRGEYIWQCVCDCGNQTTIPGYDLRSGHSSTCGCGVLAAVKKNFVKHGLSRVVPEFGVWVGMIRRCEQKTHNRYYRYGARGISVCPEWRNDFAAFYRDMGPRPTAKHSIDRVDNNGNYEPGNCRWATALEQANNKGKRAEMRLV